MKENDNGVTNFHFEIAADLLTEDHLETMRGMRPGLIQLEIGVQSANEKTLQAINRHTDMHLLRKTVAVIHSFRNIHQHLCGLAIFNINEQNRIFLETGTANKVYEYLNAGIPVVVGEIKSYIKFVEKYGVGKMLDMQKDIRAQISLIAQISIEEDFLTKNNLTMMARSKELIDFYERVKKKKIVR